MGSSAVSEGQGQNRPLPLPLGGALTADGHEINCPTFVESHPKTTIIIDSVFSGVDLNLGGEYNCHPHFSGGHQVL